MVKRKSKPKSRSNKGRKKGSSFFSEMRLLFYRAVIVIVCLVGFLFLYDYLPSKQTEPTDKTLPTPTPKKKESFLLRENMEIPKLLTKRTEQVIHHEGYTVSYNSDHRIANWVAYVLTSEEAESKKNERSNKFVVDPQVKGATATNEDYTRTGYDRGHMAPAGDMKWSVKAMRESFYLSNICPQKPGLNRGIWKELEEECRILAKENGQLMIVCGPIIKEDMRRIGKNRVSVPASFYKVLCYVRDGEAKGIGFLFDNRDYGHTKLESMAIPIDSVEKVTNIDFFPSMEKKRQEKMEASVDRKSWSI